MGKDGIFPVVISIPAKKGDTYLLCSDGLSSVLSESEIAAIVKRSEFEEIPSQLISATKAKGAPDNVTVIWAEIVDGADEYLQLLGAAHE
jgi:serine/threonine protein phosphatase PrpC